MCIDEPVDQSTFNELVARTSRGGAGGKRGTVAISLTPVGGVDVTYIKEMIERGFQINQIEESVDESRSTKS